MKDLEIKAIIGLGNPGIQYKNTRHNIGFEVIDALADRCGADWQARDAMLWGECFINGKKVIVVKPQTYMNNSGQVIPFLQKKGIKPENILVIHDELELPVGAVKMKTGGSAKGHNGLRSIIAHCGPEFHRVRVGIGRPDDRSKVSDYVLSKFLDNLDTVATAIEEAVTMIESVFG